MESTAESMYNGKDRAQKSPLSLSGKDHRGATPPRATVLISLDQQSHTAQATGHRPPYHHGGALDSFDPDVTMFREMIPTGPS